LLIEVQILIRTLKHFFKSSLTKGLLYEQIILKTIWEICYTEVMSIENHPKIVSIRRESEITISECALIKDVV
jgi:hypothetical protein